MTTIQVLGSMILLLISFSSYSQTIRNPSLEGPTGSNNTPIRWMKCGQESTPDTQPGYWGETKAPSDKTSYLQLVVRQDGTNEKVTQILSGKMQQDSVYYFFLDLAKATLEEPCKLRIWAGYGFCGKAQLLWESPSIEHNEWRTYLACFTAEADFSSIMLESIHSGIELNQGKVSIDNMKGIFLGAKPESIVNRDTTLCDGESLILTFPEEDSLKYEWEATGNATIAIVESGIYPLKINWNGFLLRDTINVHYVPRPSLNLGNDTSLCLGSSLNISIDLVDADFLWQDFTTSSEYQVDMDGQYYVRANTEYCIIADTINVTYFDCEYLLEMPNIFTPNGDGVNDLYYPIQVKGVNNPIFQIFDRWGRVCYSTHSLNAWDGMAFGKILPEGVYFWSIQFETPLSDFITQNGAFTLVR